MIHGDKQGSTTKDPKNVKPFAELDVLGYKIPCFTAELGLWGLYETMTRKLYLHHTIPGGPLAEADTLLHEVIHAIENVALEGSDRLAERQVNTLATVLIDTLRRNQWLRDYLFTRLTSPTLGGTQADG